MYYTRELLTHITHEVHRQSDNNILEQHRVLSRVLYENEKRYKNNCTYFVKLFIINSYFFILLLSIYFKSL